jgi:hypothetical protein
MKYISVNKITKIKICIFLAVFWVVSQRSLLAVHQRFGGKYGLHLQG